MALAELLAASDLPARERGWAEALKGAAEHLEQLTSVVVDGAKADATGLVLRAQEFSPRRLAEGIAASLQARTAAKGLQAAASIADDLPDNATGDPVRLARRAGKPDRQRHEVHQSRPHRLCGKRGSRRRRPHAPRLQCDRRWHRPLSGRDRPAVSRHSHRPPRKPHANMAEQAWGSLLRAASRVRWAAISWPRARRAKAAPSGWPWFSHPPAPECPLTTGLFQGHRAFRGSAAHPVRRGQSIRARRHEHDRACARPQCRFRWRRRGSGVGGRCRQARHRADGPHACPVSTAWRPRAAFARCRARPARFPISAFPATREADDAQAARTAGMDDYLAKPVSPAALARAIAGVAERLRRA